MRADDECYTGTGPAAEVVGQATQAQPSYAELLAQRDALQSKLDSAIWALEKIGAYKGEGPTYTTPWQDIVRSLGEIAREALSRIKGA